MTNALKGAAIAIFVAASSSGCGSPQQASSSIPAAQHFGANFAVLAVAKNRNYKLIYSFDGTDGFGPEGLTLVNGTLYGIANGGGSCYIRDCGTVFAITPSGSERTIYNFQGGKDGRYPEGSLVNVNGTLYGVTRAGGNTSGPCGYPNDGCGTVFKVSTSGTERVLYRFKGGNDGDYALAGLTALKGTLYGTTGHGGGPYSDGTVFQVSLTGHEKVLHRFSGGSIDGAEPSAPLVALNGKLYGTTYSGGCTECDGGYGTVFSITPSGVEHMLYAFQGAQYGDGALPEAGLVALNDVLYGTTAAGGYDKTSLCGSSSGHGLGGCGTVFSIIPSGKEAVLYRFKGSPDGDGPGQLIAQNGRLFGTTGAGGIGSAYYGGYGTAFDISVKGRERVLYSFKGAPDGNSPQGLTADGKTLYGTTFLGGGDCQKTNSEPSGCGSVFKLTP